MPLRSGTWVGRWIVAYFGGLPGGALALIGTVFLMNASTFMSVPMLSVHLQATLGLGPLALGTVLSLALVGPQLWPLATGPLADRFGHRRFLLGGLVLRAGAFAGLAVAADPIWLALAALALGLGEASYESGVYGLLARQPAVHRPRLFLLNNQALNLGVIAGPALGFLALGLDPSGPFLASAVAFAGLAAIMATAPWARRMASAGDAAGEDGPGGDEDADDEAGASGGLVRRVTRTLTDPRFLALSVAMLPWWFLYTQLFVSFPIRFVDLTGDEGSVGLVYLVNGVVGLAVALMALPLFRRYRETTILPVGLVIAVAALGIGLGAEAAGVFLVFVGLYTVAESLVLPSADTAIARIARRGSESTYFGLSDLSGALGGALGHYVGSWLILTQSPRTAWWVFLAVGVAGLAGLLAARRVLDRGRG